MDQKNTEQSIDEPKVSFFRKWGVLIVLSLALAIIIIDATLLNVSFSYLIKDLKTDIKSLQWVITAYSLTIAALTITGGRLGDLYGRKRMFMLGAILFAIGSLMASYSNTVSQMIVGESIIEGIGAALMMPATASLLVSAFKGRDRALAFGVWGGIAASASAIGPVLGGYLTTHYTWRYGFRINVVVAAILLIGSVLIKEYRDIQEKKQLDIFGVILSSLGLFSLVFGIIESSTYGWIRAKEIFSIGHHTIDLGKMSIVAPALIIGFIVLTLFVLWEKYVESKGNTPLVSIKLLQNRQFMSGTITVTVMALGQAGLIFSVPIFFQAVRGFDAYHTGLAILPSSIAALIIAPISAVMTKKIPAKKMIQLGLLISAASMMILRSELTLDATARDFLPGLIIYGIGIGLMMAQINNIVLSSVSVQQAGEASGISNTMRQLGSTLGTAIIGAVMLSSVTVNMTSGINDSTIIPTPAKAKIVDAASKQSSNIEFNQDALTNKIPTPIRKEMKTIVNTATTDSNKTSVLWAALFLVLGFATSFWLPNLKGLEKAQAGKGEK